MATWAVVGEAEREEGDALARRRTGAVHRRRQRAMRADETRCACADVVVDGERVQAAANALPATTQAHQAPGLISLHPYISPFPTRISPIYFQLRLVLFISRSRTNHPFSGPLPTVCSSVWQEPRSRTYTVPAFHLARISLSLGSCQGRGASIGPSYQTPPPLDQMREVCSFVMTFSVPRTLF